MTPAINITERIVYRVLVDLEKDGCVTHQRTGRGTFSRLTMSVDWNTNSPGIW